LKQKNNIQRTIKIGKFFNLLTSVFQFRSPNFGLRSSVFGLPSLLLFFFLLLTSCANKTFNNEQELWTYLKNPDNGYLQQKNINGYDFSLLYKPTDLLVAQELGENTSKERITALREKYQKQLYFTLSMSRNGKGKNLEQW
jgi:hypothetical protein